MSARILSIIFTLFIFMACQTEADKPEVLDPSQSYSADIEKDRLEIYSPVKLTTDVTQLSDAEKEMIPLFIDAAKIMDTLFWLQAYGLPDTFLAKIEDPKLKAFAKINYGPWDRLNDMQPFLEGFGAKPLGANFYPHDMSKEELQSSNIEDKNRLYSVIRRKEDKSLHAIPYHVYYRKRLSKARQILLKAAALAEDTQLKKYLKLRAEALMTSDYDASDRAWLDLENNGIDLIIGPIENYEDKLLNARAAFEAYVLVKDKAWSERLKKYVQYLPELQRGLPVPEKYKAEEPGRDAQLNAYDVVYYAGDCNAASKTIAVNLPNDETIQKEKGTRRSQLKNAMKAKFDKILLPISKVLIAEDQRKHITFEAFFANTMFHEVAHGLGIKNVVGTEQTVRAALEETYSALEEGKADVLGLYMVTQMFEKGVLSEGTLEDYYVTFMAGIFRSVRFGASSAHGQSNMIRFNYFKEKGAFTRDEAKGTYAIDMDKMQLAMKDLSHDILVLQGDGDKSKVEKMIQTYGAVGDQLQKDLDRLNDAGIPVDIVFEQGTDVLGL